MSVALLAAMATALAAQAGSSAAVGPTVATSCSAVEGAGKERFPAYLEDSFAQLKDEVPKLHGLRFEASAVTDAGDGVLGQTGEAIAVMMPRVPNLLANEDLSQVTVPMPFTVDELRTASSGAGAVPNGGRGNRGAPPPSVDPRKLEGKELEQAIHDMLMLHAQHVNFGYRIEPKPDAKLGTVLDESRTNVRGEAIQVDPTNPNNPHAAGFGNAWLMFVPANQRESRFRYLGRQKMDGHETVVVAFAQVPEKVGLPGRIVVGGNDCRFYSQGVAWIDAAAAQIVRLQTDLLTPVPAVGMKRLRSEIDFNTVNIARANLTLWMPKSVEVSWESTDQAGAELHKYSKYRLFRATSRVVMPDEAKP